MVALVASFDACAWMDQWAPEVKFEPAAIKKLSAHSISNFVNATLDESLIGISIKPEFSGGASVDLNNDGITDFIFIIPWIGNGLNAVGCTAHFIVSDGKGGRIENTLDGYGLDLADLVKKNEKIYMRHSTFVGNFKNSRHNHWVFQIFSFGADGIIRCSNHEYGDVFPAATIYYENPRFKRVQLTKLDIDKIVQSTTFRSHKYTGR